MSRSATVSDNPSSVGTGTGFSIQRQGANSLAHVSKWRTTWEKSNMNNMNTSGRTDGAAGITEPKMAWVAPTFQTDGKRRARGVVAGPM